MLGTVFLLVWHVVEQLGTVWIQSVPLCMQLSFTVFVVATHCLLEHPAVFSVQVVLLIEHVVAFVALEASQFPVLGLQAYVVRVQTLFDVEQVGAAHLTVAHLSMTGAQHCKDRMEPQEMLVSSL